MTPWTELTSTLALGLGANTENLPLGLAYGLRGRRIGLVPNLLIATVTTAVTLLPLVVSRGLRGFMPAQLPDALAGLLLIALGLFDIWIDRRKREQISRAPLGKSGWVASIGWREALLLAGTLSLNNIGLGLAGGIAGLSHGPVAWVASACCFFGWVNTLGRTIALPSTAFGWIPLDGNILIIEVGLFVMTGL